MSTYSTDDQLLLRVPLCASALQRINSERAKLSVAAATFEAYREEAQRKLLVDLAARNISVAQISDTTTLTEPEVCLTATLLFEAATVRTALQTAQPDVFATAAITWRAAYVRALGDVRLTPLERPRGSAGFSWDRA